MQNTNVAQLKEINIDSETIPEEFLNDKNLSNAVKLAVESAYTEPELRAYDSYLDAVITHKTMLGDLFRDGMHNQSKIVAKKMIQKGSSIEDIADMTDLSSETIRKLIDESKNIN